MGFEFVITRPMYVIGFIKIGRCAEKVNTNTNVFAEILEDIGSTLNKTFSTETHQCLSLASQKATSTVIFS